ncbi:MAG TPA: HAMP domain-containing sensor histidine kinase [Ktedonobacteraceae bacterium]
MLMFYRFCLTLRRLSWTKRLFIVLLSFSLLEALLAYLTIQGKESGIASILILPGILAALLFPWKKAFALEFFLLLIYLGTNMTIKGWNSTEIIAFALGTLIDCFIIVIVAFLRHAWEMAEEAKQKEKKLAGLKDQFITNIHHELRSPLTAVLGPLDILRDNGDQITIEERNMFLDHAIYAGNELQRIADNILDAMRADSDVSSPWIKEFELDRVISDVLRHIDTFDHFLHIDITNDIVVRGDSQQVGQVIRNLLSNCFKYSPKGSPVTVRVWRDDAYAYVCVKDKGPGISTHHIPLIFQKFSRLEHDIAGPVRGIGLGLYICRRLIENMEGRIWVESTGIPGKGSSFYFTLPCASVEVMEPRVQRILVDR